MSFLSKIVDKIKEVAADILDELEQLTIVFISSLAATIIKGGGSVLIDAARDAVKQAQETGGSPSEKLEAAKASVISTLEAKGIPVIMNAVNGAIEAAVAQLKDDGKEANGDTVNNS